MDVILLKKVENLGDIGDKASVKPGFARNFLIPTGRALPATETNLKEFEARRATLEKDAQELLARARGRATALEDLTVTITANCGLGGKLFGSIGPADIAKAVSEAGVEVQKSEVRMPEGPLRQTGEAQIGLHLHTDVDAVVAVVVVGQEEEQ